MVRKHTSSFTWSLLVIALAIPLRAARGSTTLTLNVAFPICIVPRHRCRIYTTTAAIVRLQEHHSIFPNRRRLLPGDCRNGTL